MESRYDVLLEGTPFVDLTFSFERLLQVPSLGQEILADNFAMSAGSTFNAAYQMSGLGLRVGLFAALGNDTFSHFVGQRMDEADLSQEFITWHDEPLPVISAAISTPEDRLFISYQAPRLRQIAMPRISIEVLERYRPEAIVMWDVFEPEVIERAREMGTLLVLDTYWDVAYLRSPVVRERAAMVDIITPNLPEALEMTGTQTAEEALDALEPWCRTVVITTGAQGCIASRDGRRYALQPIAVETRDTTGAGESFIAGLVYGMLRGYEFERALKCGLITGALSTQALGGSGWRASSEAVESRLGGET